MEKLKDCFIDFICNGEVEAFIFVTFLILCLFINYGFIFALLVVLPIEIVVVFFAKIVYNYLHQFSKSEENLFKSIAIKALSFVLLFAFTFPLVVVSSNFIASNVLRLQEQHVLHDPDAIDGVPSRFQ